MSRLLTALAACLVATPLLAQDRVIRVGENGTQPPRKVVDVPPEYPADARAECVSGIVVLDITVDTAGRVSSIDEIRSPDERLTRAASDAVRQWEYEVTRLNGEPVAVRFNVTVNFSVSCA